MCCEFCIKIRSLQILTNAADVNQQYHGVGLQVVQQQQQQQQLTSSKIVYVQAPAGDVTRPWNARHYPPTQSKCLGTALVIVGCVSVGCNVVMAVFSGDWASYLLRVMFLGMMVSNIHRNIMQIVWLVIPGVGPGYRGAGPKSVHFGRAMAWRGRAAAAQSFSGCCRCSQAVMEG